VAALPVRSVWLGAVKLLSAVVAILIPLLLLMLLGAIARPLSDSFVRASEDHWLVGGVTGVIAVHMLLLTAAAGTGRGSEIIAAGWGLGALALWGLAAALALANRDIAWMQPVRWIGPPFEWLDAALNPAVPGAIGLVPTQYALGVTSMLTLGGIIVARYAGAVEPLIERRWMGWNIVSREGRLLYTPVGALLWKQLHETLPLSGLVLGIALIISTLLCIAGAPVQPVRSGRETEQWLTQSLVNFAMLACVGGFVLALLIGVGTFLPDLERRVNTFWRSRPISAHHWFWTKYGVDWPLCS
jgi:hypothetical protein